MNYFHAGAQLEDMIFMQGLCVLDKYKDIQQLKRGMLSSFANKSAYCSIYPNLYTVHSRTCTELMHLFSVVFNTLKAMVLLLNTDGQMLH